MRAVLQRVLRASVTVQGREVASIGQGLLALVGVARGDGLQQAKWLAEKTASLRVFEDEQGKMNLSVLETGGSVLAVSQFTLMGDSRKGRRPSFVAAAPPEEAEELYRSYIHLLEIEGCSVHTGVFRTHMEVALINDGPVTIVLDTPENEQ